jgi:2-(S-pantetheinyl)-carbapenam-3-carboxylate methyltransferase
MTVMRVGLVQINIGLTWSDARVGDDAPPLSYSLLPYSIGLLQAYASQHSVPGLDCEFLLPIIERLPVAEAAAHLRAADVVGFSSYIWNIRLSLEIAREVRRQNPDALIVFGGPQVPDHAERFLREHRFVDVACHGEGEATFSLLLANAGTRRWDTVPGISYLTAGDLFVTHPRSPRIADLAEIPSPYLEGAFRPLLEARPREQWVATWETNRGCPFSCSFCDWGSAVAGRVYRFDMGRLRSELAWMAAQRIGFVFCCDANFGMLPRDLEIAEAVVESRRRTGFPYSFSVQSSKNATERVYRIQKLLATSLNTHGVTLSLQSMDVATLASIRRGNISSASFQELQRRFAREGLYTYTDLILGLPDETYATFADGVSQVIEGGQHNHIQFHNCSLLPNAEMGDPAYQRRYGMETVSQRMTAVHGRTDQEDGEEAPEYLDIVVATATMPRADWVRAKVFSWMTDLLYFDRLLQIPFATLGGLFGLRCRELVEHLVTAEAASYPVIGRLHDTLREKARDIQRGGSEYVTAPGTGGIWWPADQLMLITLVANGDLGAFYTEVGHRLGELLQERGVDRAGAAVLDEALRLNETLVRVPFQEDDLHLVLGHNLWEFYRSLLQGGSTPLKERLTVYRVDRTTRRWPTMEQWFQYLTWCHNKDKRGYLYDAIPVIGAETAAVA